ncbi:MAG: amino acid ABC transporter permease [Cyanobacteria bacterium J06642_2]
MSPHAVVRGPTAFFSASHNRRDRGVHGAMSQMSVEKGFLRQLQAVPLWVYVLAIAAVAISIGIFSSPGSQDILKILARGFGLTLRISLLSYAMAVVIGLIAGLGRVSANPIVHTLATLYVEILRGVPILVVVLYVAFVLGSQSIELFGREFAIRSNFWRAAIALSLSYGAYLAEVIRSGIQAIPKGQIEASRALGLGPLKTLGLVVVPQAFRIVLPPLGNDFIALIKDSSLASVISVAELTQQTRFYVSRTFDTFGGWTMAALLYLSLTLILSLGVRLLERYSRVNER